MRERIRGYADAVLDEADSRLGTIADEVAAIDDLLRASDDLRGALTDPGLPAHVRRSVLTDLLGDRVDGTTLRLLVEVVDEGRPTELVDDVAWLVERTRAAADDLHAVSASPLGRIAALERVEGFTGAVLAALRASDSGNFDEIEDELFRFARVIEGSDQLMAVLSDRDVAVEAREGLVTTLLQGKATPATIRLARYATRVGRPRDYVTLLDAITERVAEETQRHVAEVRAPIELTDEQRERLAAALTRIEGRQIDVRVIVDPSVLGGFVATIGDSIVDASARHRLDQLRERLILPDANFSA